MKNLRRSLSVMLAMLMILAMTVVPALAYTTPGLEMLTLNSSDFTILKQTNSNDFTIEVFGLDSSYNWLNLTQADKDEIEWTIDSGNSARFNVGGTPSTTATGSPVTITMTGNVGTTTVRAHLDGLSGWDNGDVTANIVVERTTGAVSYVSDINIVIDFSDYDNIHSTNYGIIQETEDVYVTDGGLNLLPDVLKMDPSAMTTIGTMKDLAYIDDFTTDPEGGYMNTVTPIGSITAIGYDYTLYKGWQVEIYDEFDNLLTQYSNMSPSIVPLQDGYTVKWIWR